MANFEEALASFVDGLDDEDLVSIWNECCVECHLDDFIYLNNEDFFVENFSNPYDVVLRISFGKYNFNDTYVVFNGYANLETFNAPEEQIYKPELVEWLMNNVGVAEDYGFEYDEDDEE